MVFEINVHRRPVSLVVRRKNGRVLTYYALAGVESNGPIGSRQRIVAYLGGLTAAEQDDWAKLGTQCADGCDLLRSNLTDVDVATWWKRDI